MKILYLNTSLSVLHIALIDTCQIPVFIEEIIQECDRGHHEILSDYIGNIFKKTQWIYSDIQAIIVGSGPGSFTGIRIGLAAARAMKHALNCPLLSIDNFLGLHLSTPDYSDKLIIIDSKRPEFYCQFFKESCFHTPELLTQAEIEKKYSSVPYITNSLSFSAPHLCLKHLILSKMLAYIIERLKSPHDLSAAEPFYVRPPDVTFKKPAS